MVIVYYLLSKLIFLSILFAVWVTKNFSHEPLPPAFCVRQCYLWRMEAKAYLRKFALQFPVLISSLHMSSRAVAGKDFFHVLR
ncbi:hypothetical protein Y032_0068g224 [Ancylostoma ceylanicum]|uniref:Uncharacterized protein n=1 Tax=Ancylostoma ceylanicum TaxID=53326 RepID=A0A016TYS5_9BILA|nr:hypothetical protein Y032_0068g224 [Ancylostoma ceylanicum]